MFADHFGKHMTTACSLLVAAHNIGPSMLWCHCAWVSDVSLKCVSDTNIKVIKFHSHQCGQ
jgi:hypothetical protein